MKGLRCFTIVLPVVLVAAGCGRRESTRVVAPPSAPQISEARWVFEKEALEGAVAQAASSPLVQRAIAGSGNARLTPAFGYALRLVATAADGSSIGATLLPYIVDGDSTHAVFVSLLERDGRRQSDAEELIFGREPTALETGFNPVRIGSAIGWMKSGSSYAADARGLPRLAHEKFNWLKFTTCVLTGAQAACEAGAEIASIVAPGVPQARAIGCGIGVAFLAAGCAGGSFGS